MTNGVTRGGGDDTGLPVMIVYQHQDVLHTEEPGCTRIEKLCGVHLFIVSLLL